MLLRLEVTSSRLLVCHLQFNISMIVSGVNARRLTASHRKWLALPQVSSKSLILLLILEDSDEVMMLLLSMMPKMLGCLTTS